MTVTRAFGKYDSTTGGSSHPQSRDGKGAVSYSSVPTAIRVLPWYRPQSRQRIGSGSVHAVASHSDGDWQAEPLLPPLGVNVITSHMGRRQSPSPMRANLLNRGQYRIATDPVKATRSLIHQFRLESFARGMHF